MNNLYKNNFTIKSVDISDSTLVFLTTRMFMPALGGTTKDNLDEYSEMNDVLETAISLLPDTSEVVDNLSGGTKYYHSHVVVLNVCTL